MLKLAKSVCEIYGAVIDEDLLTAGVILHDISKCKEFVLSDIGVVKEYSTDGQMFGHAIMCAYEVGQVGMEFGLDTEKTKLLQHVILSHHGDPEFGAAVKPMCIEAELLHCIDMLDSRAEIYIETTADLGPREFSKKIYALDKCVFRHR